MRLTNVAQMSLPPGELLSFPTRTTARDGRALPVSFDQRRHVGEGDRPGSWMAVAFRLPPGTSLDALDAAWMRVIARHGTLRTAFSRDDDGELSLHEIDIVGGEWRRHPVPDGQPTRVALRELLDAACAPFARPSHRLCVVVPHTGDAERGAAASADPVGPGLMSGSNPEVFQALRDVQGVGDAGRLGDDQGLRDDQRPAGDAGIVVIVGADHAHVDMWSLLVIVRDLVARLEGGAAEESPAASFAEHSAALERMPSAPAAVTRRWNEILAEGEGAMPRFPLPLGDLSSPRREVVEVRDVLGPADAQRLEAAASDRGVRTTALAMSVLTEVTARLTGATLGAVFPVHSRHEPRWHDSVGWFITNSVIRCREPEPALCAAAVKEALALGSHPLGPIFAPHGGMPANPGMFAISWLDTRRLPAVDDALQIQYVSAVIDTDGVMIWFLLNDQGLHLRCRYPDTPQSRTNVGTWLDDVVNGLRAAVGRAVPAAPGIPPALHR